MLKVNDFFCGAGGMGLGFKQAGFQLAGAWDFDKYAVKSYSSNVSSRVKQADITRMSWDEIPYADVWTFGFPCQDISIAGKKNGMIKGKTRSGLFYEIMRLLEETEKNNRDHLPSIILAENVKAVKTYLPVIEKEYEARGYKMYAILYNSKYWGLPQQRDRFFVLGVHKSIGEEFYFKEQQTDFIPKLSSILEENVDDKYYIPKDKAKAIIEQAMKRVDLIGTHACLTPNRVDKRQNGRRAKSNEEEMFTLTAQDRHGVIIVVDNPDNKKQNNIIDIYNTKEITDCFDVRLLTTREYARLQGFPDEYQQVVSDSQFFKQMGNAVSVPVAKGIAETINNWLVGLEHGVVSNIANS